VTMKATAILKSTCLRAAVLAGYAQLANGDETIALWLFDEPVGLYPSSVLNDSSGSDMPMVIGLGARIGEGRFGNGLVLESRDTLEVPIRHEFPKKFGFVQLEPEQGRSTPPMSWFNADFAALMTSGEQHLRKEVGFVNPTASHLNLGDFDWSVDFWHLADVAESSKEAVVFELGTGPRGENDHITQLKLSADRSQFELINHASGTALAIPTSIEAGGWQHFAFVYDASEDQLRHFVDGSLQPLPAASAFASLAFGAEAYFTFGRDGHWDRPLGGVLDEVRFRLGLAYERDFEPPPSFASAPPETRERLRGAPLLFGHSPLDLGSRKHLFIDASIFEETGNTRFVVNPPRRAERVMGEITGDFRKHLTVVEGDDGVIRIYNSVEDDFLAVYTSTDGIRFEAPDLGRGRINGRTNIVLPEMVGGLGNPFFQPHAPAAERWKYLSDYHRRGVYLYTSPDGYTWTRSPIAILPFRSGTQSATFYDDQRGRYVAYHRSGIFHTPAGDTHRSSVVTEHRDLRIPLGFQPLSQAQYRALTKDYPLREPLPWFFDNGPLTPGGFGMEFPHRFGPAPEDPVGVDFYVTKATKYPWAPDTYLAFPIAYFHYERDGPEARQVLGLPERGLGSGPLETQIAVSRNGIDWHRYPEPAYVGIGRHEGRNVVTAYIAHGMVRRGDEIWQYYFGETQYHSAFKRAPEGRGVYRLVQRLDGFVSMDSPYGDETTAITKPLVFSGERLEINVDTDAVGYVQVGLLDARGAPIKGFTVDECVYINGDFIAKEVEWLSGGSLSEVEGEVVQVVLRMSGAKLYAMQFGKARS